MRHNAPADLTGWRPVTADDEVLYYVPDRGAKVVKVAEMPELIETWSSAEGLEGRARVVEAAAIAAGWKLKTPRWSRWRLGAGDHTTVSLSLVDPSDGHVEAAGMWTDGKWDHGAHATPDGFPKRIGYRQLRDLAALPPGRYYEDPGVESDD